MTKQILRALICCSLVFSTYGQCLGDTKHVECSVTETVSWGNDRVHVKCSNKPDGIDYFAVPVDASGAGIRLAAAGNAAMQNPTWIFSLDYCPNDSSGPNIGCAIVNCRLVMNFGLVKPIVPTAAAK